MRSIKLSAMLLVFFLNQFLFAQNNLEIDNVNRAELENTRQEHLASLLESENLPQENEIIEEKKVSPGKAILFSAIIPGAGEAYAKSWKKAILFFAAEVTGIAVNITYNNKGDDKQEVMKDYAHTHWNEEKYWTYLYYSADPDDQWRGAIDKDNPETWLTPTEIEQHMDELRTIETNDHSHTLPSTKTQQYYEMIGKYVGQFGYGWDDADFDDDLYGYDIDKITPNNINYVNIRKKSEEFYDTATKASQFVLLNHLISAIDAGFSAKVKNRKIDVALKGDIHMVKYNMMEFVGLAVNF